MATAAQSKDAQLDPLQAGERPRAVTVAAAVALAMGAGNLLAFAAGAREVAGAPVEMGQVLPTSILLLLAAAGMWRARYWAVLGFQAFLALTIVVLSLTLLSRTNALAGVLNALAIGAAGVLFWSLVKSMARIQMPRRLPREDRHA